MTTSSDERPKRGYVDAGGIRTYFEVHGSGDPLRSCTADCARSRRSRR